MSRGTTFNHPVKELLSLEEHRWEHEAIMSITAWSDELNQQLEARGIEKGIEAERRNGFLRSAAKRLKRALTESEQSALLANATPEHWDAIDDALFANDESELLSWLVPGT